MSADDSADGRAKRAKPAVKPGKRADDSANTSVGRALRTVYQKTVDESVPQDMLDLLGKLG